MIIVDYYVGHQVYGKERVEATDALLFVSWGIAWVSDVTKCDRNYLFCLILFIVCTNLPNMIKSLSHINVMQVQPRLLLGAGIFNLSVGDIL